MRYLFLFASTCMLCMSSCQKDITDTIDITEYRWELKYVKTDGKKERPDTDYTLIFGSDSSFSLDFSINSSAGRYHILEPGLITVQEYTNVTEAGQSNYDNLLQSAMLSTSSYEVLGDALILKGDGEIKFTKLD